MTAEWADKQFPPHPCHFYKASPSLQVCHKSFVWEKYFTKTCTRNPDWSIQTPWTAAHKHPSWPCYPVLCLIWVRPSNCILNLPPVLSDTFSYTEQADHLLTVTAVKNVYHLHTGEEKYQYWKTVFLQVLWSHCKQSQGVAESILWVWFYNWS